MSIFTEAFDKIGEFAESRTGKTVIRCAEVGVVAGLTYVAIRQTKKLHDLQGEVQSLQEQMAANEDGLGNFDPNDPDVVNKMMQALASANQDIKTANQDIKNIQNEVENITKEVSKLSEAVKKQNDSTTELINNLNAAKTEPEKK